MYAAGYDSSVVSLDNGYAYSLSYSNDGSSAGSGILTVAAAAGVPESSTLVSALLRRSRGSIAALREVPESSTLVSALLLLSTGGLLLMRRELKRRIYD